MFFLKVYFRHTNNYNTLYLQFITINSNYRLVEDFHVNNFILIVYLI